MAAPITYTFKTSKQRVIELLPKSIKKPEMQLMGCNKRLGLISIRQRSGSMLYAHIVENKNATTQVSMGPGLSYLGERDQSEVPEAAIQHIMNKLNYAIKNDHKSDKPI